MSRANSPTVFGHLIGGGAGNGGGGGGNGSGSGSSIRTASSSHRNSLIHQSNTVLRTVSYDQTRPGKPPIPITTAPTPSSAQLNIHPSLRPRTAPHTAINLPTLLHQQHLRRAASPTTATSSSSTTPGAPSSSNLNATTTSTANPASTAATTATATTAAPDRSTPDSNGQTLVDTSHQSHDTSSSAAINAVTVAGSPSNTHLSTGDDGSLDGGASARSKPPSNRTSDLQRDSTFTTATSSTTRDSHTTIATTDLESASVASVRKPDSSAASLRKAKSFTNHAPRAVAGAEAEASSNSARQNELPAASMPSTDSSAVAAAAAAAPAVTTQSSPATDQTDKASSLRTSPSLPRINSSSSTRSQTTSNANSSSNPDSSPPAASLAPSLTPTHSIASSAKRTIRWGGSRRSPASTVSSSSKRTETTPPQLPKPSFLGPAPASAPAAAGSRSDISFDDLLAPDRIDFSKRGSMLIAGRKARDGSLPSHLDTPTPSSPTRRSRFAPSSPSRLGNSNTASSPKRNATSSSPLASSDKNAELPLPPSSASRDLPPLPSDTPPSKSSSQSPSSAIPTSKTRRLSPTSTPTPASKAPPPTMALATKPTSDTTAGLDNTDTPGPKIVPSTDFPTVSATDGHSSDTAPAPASILRASDATPPPPSMKPLALDVSSTPVPPSTAIPVSPTFKSTPAPNKPLPRPPSGLTARIPSRIISPDDAIMSFKVRSLYDCAPDEEATSSAEHAAGGAGVADIAEHALEDEAAALFAQSRLDPPKAPALTGDAVRSISAPTTHEETGKAELAGGLEDWRDVANGDVDRYGFIVPQTKGTAESTVANGASPPPSRLHRVSSALQLASSTPRRERSTLRRPLSRPASVHSNQSGANGSTTKGASGAPNAAPSSGLRPPSSQSSPTSANGRPISRLRSAANRLPYNRARRTLDEAGDMLTLPPGSTMLTDTEASAQATLAQRKKEWQRDAKWRKMAHVQPPGPAGAGGGADYDFEPAHPKLVSRTWKGIPDRWRAVAWHSFLRSSVRKQPAGSQPTDAELILCFHELLDQPSPDDVQIDLDVPRTIGGHVLFRRRYRGGQRLLFRVLHAMSLYLPDIGYVQGMASLAATFLCYYEEQMAFVMLVRMWTLRGLGKLYTTGFLGLMQALEELEQGWLKGTPVASRLDALGVAPTSYGTRWYLTVFNYSIPFPAQLRVWDVFLLLGDSDPLPRPSTAPNVHRNLSTSHANGSSGKSNSDGKGLNGTTSANGGNPDAHMNGRTGSLGGVDGARRPKTANGAGGDALHHADLAGDLASGGFRGGLDVLHATSAALIDGMRDLLLDADFENAMKVLTSWVPIRDEDLLMRVARQEWKLHRRKRR